MLVLLFVHCEWLIELVSITALEGTTTLPQLTALLWRCLFAIYIPTPQTVPHRGNWQTHEDLYSSRGCVRWSREVHSSMHTHSNLQRPLLLSQIDSRHSRFAQSDHTSTTCSFVRKSSFRSFAPKWPNESTWRKAVYFTIWELAPLYIAELSQHGLWSFYSNLPDN